MKKLIQILCFIFIIGCGEKNQQGIDSVSIDPIKSEKDLPTGNEIKRSRFFRQISAIALQGDLDAYNSLRSDYLQSDKESEVLVYSLIMAHKYDKAWAYRHVYHDLVGVMLLGNFVDSNLASLAVDYLYKAAEKGDSIAIWNIKAHNMHPDMDIVNNFLTYYRIRPDTIIH